MAERVKTCGAVMTKEMESLKRSVGELTELVMESRRDGSSTAKKRKATIPVAVSEDGEVPDEDDGAFDINPAVNNLFEDAPDSEEGELDDSEDKIQQGFLEKNHPKEGRSPSRRKTG